MVYVTASIAPIMTKFLHELDKGGSTELDGFAGGTTMSNYNPPDYYISGQDIFCAWAVAIILFVIISLL